MRRVLLIFCCLSLSCGCSMVKSSKKWYREYLNTSPTVDLTVQAEQECAPLDFASLFVPVDTRLNAFGRDLAAQDTYPTDQWFDMFMQRYPWVGSITAVNIKGEVLDQRVNGEPKDADYAALCAGDWKNRQPRGSFETGESGTDIFLTMPFFKDTNCKGCLVARFSPKDLVRYSPHSESVVMFGPRQEVLWAGQYADRIDGLVDHPWSDLLKEQVSGEITAYDQKFFWLGRAFAGTWLIYVAHVPE